MKYIFNYILLCIFISMTGCSKEQLPVPWVVQCYKNEELLIREVHKQPFSISIQSEGDIVVDYCILKKKLAIKK